MNMNQERLLQVVIAPHISEKATTLAEQKNRQLVFKVLLTATKPEIKTAIEKLFDVKVDHVRVVKVKGKSRRHGRTQGRRSDWKKAYIALKDGYDINFAEIV